jgi:hypothetical protein
MVIQAVQDADVPSEEKVKALEALKEATMQVYDAVLGGMETIKAAKMKWFQTQMEVLKRLEAVAAQAASTPEPSDAEMLQAHYPEVAAGTPPAKPPKSGLEPMAHAGEVATILIDLMERGGKPTYSYAELQRAFRDADTGFRHRSFVQATKLLKERGYYPTGNVLVYNPHPASQPSEGAKEQSAGA